MSMPTAPLGAADQGARQTVKIAVCPACARIQVVVSFQSAAGTPSMARITSSGSIPATTAGGGTGAVLFQVKVD